MGIQTLRIGLLVLVGWHLVGCASGQPADKSGPSAAGMARITEAELQNELDEFADRFSGVVSTASNEVSKVLPDRTTRKAALLWKLRVIPRLQAMIFGADPQEAFLDAATLTVQMRKYLEGPETDGATLFADAQPTAIVACRLLEDDIFRIGGLFLNAQQLETLRAEVEAFSDAHPIRGTFALAGGRATSTKEARTGSFDWVTAIPMSPFRAFEGIDAGAHAISDFNTTAGQFSQIVEDLPLQTRWQIELLWFEMEERESISGALNSFKMLADSALSLAETARLVIDAEEVGGLPGVTLEDADRRSRGVTDHLAWRALQLIFVTFVLAVIYRLTSTRLSKQSPAAPR